MRSLGIECDAQSLGGACCLCLGSPFAIDTLGRVGQRSKLSGIHVFTSKTRIKIMKRITKANILQNSRFAYWSILGGMMLLTPRLYAPFQPPPYLAISRPTTNTVSITVVSGGSYNYALQMSTNLTGSSWVNIQTNYSFVTPVIFTNM